MGTEDTLSSPPLSSKDEKEAQKVPDPPYKNGTLNVTHKWTGFQGKTLWDWLQLLGVLAIPLVVVGATIGFGLLQLHLADVQHQQDQQSANIQHVQDQQNALDQQRAAILQTYIDNIQDLLLNHNLLGSKATDDIAILARARTLTALQGLDPERQGRLVQFIYEAKLIGFLDSKGKRQASLIVLTNADLKGADLSSADLKGADLSSTGLKGADLSSTGLYSANLSNAHLEQADLEHAYLEYAYLYGVYLSNANLKGADLKGANLSSVVALTQQQLDQVYSCKNAILPPGLTCHHNQ